MENSSQTEDWGRLGYGLALERQLAYVEKRKRNEIADTLIFVEHPPVYTIGARPGAEKHLIWQAEELKLNGVEVIKTNRGGDITYHGPGQLVGYPIVDWSGQKDLHAYLRLLEDVLISTLAQFGLKGQRREGKTGIWIEDRKIAAIGVAVKSWVTYHGFSLNLDPDLTHFGGIVPCGITDGSVTSFTNEGQPAPLPGKIKTVLSLEFWRNIGNS